MHATALVNGGLQRRPNASEVGHYVGLAKHDGDFEGRVIIPVIERGDLSARGQLRHRATWSYLLTAVSAPESTNNRQIST